MGPDLIAVLPPGIDLHCGILQVWKPVLVEALQTKTTVERLDKRIVGGLSGPGEIQDNPVRKSTQIKFFGGELAAVAHSDPPRAAKLREGLIQGVYHIGDTGLSLHPECWTHAAQVIHYRQNPDPTAIDQHS